MARAVAAPCWRRAALLDAELTCLIKERASEVFECLYAGRVDDGCGVRVHGRTDGLVLSFSAGEGVKVLVAVVEQHIFVGSKAAWDEIPGSAPQYEESGPVFEKRQRSGS